DGRNKLFFFANFQRNYDNSVARNSNTSTVPANPKHLEGDFSDLLTLPGNTAQFRIYDPLTVRPDPANPGRFIRTPFPNNIIPKDRFMNPDGSYKSPLFALYKDMVPAPNQNFVEQGSIPQSNYFRAAEPNATTGSSFGGRIDFNASAKDRFFFRYSGTTWLEQLGDWTYNSPTQKYRGLHTSDKTRYSWSYVGNWTRVTSGGVVFDTQFATNRFFEDQQRRNLHQFKPTDLGLPSYLDAFCSGLSQCMLPRIQFTGSGSNYQGVSNSANGGLDATHVQGQSTVTAIKGAHTLRGGVDLRLAMRRNNLIAAGDVSSNYEFTRDFTRAADSETNFPASNIGPQLAALMLGIPTRVSIGQEAAISLRNPYYGGFIQDSWRLTQNLTLNLGLRYEFEDGITETDDRWITEFDPNAQLAITQLAQEAYARSPIPQVPVGQFSVRGGSLYAGAPGATGKSWAGESMWMPRASAAYKLGERTVVKGGYGMYFDTLNAADYTTFNQLGYSSSTVNVSSTDFGQTWLLGNPAAGILPISNPFPVRADGQRFEAPLEDALGVNAIVGQQRFRWEDPNHKHSRVQRWRFGVQREFFGNTSVEVAYSGQYADRLERAIAGSYIPESFYVGGQVRDNSAQSLLTQNVTNPFHISNFASLKTSDPALYNQMANNSFFQATTTQRANLIRQFPHLSGNPLLTSDQNPLQMNNRPLGVLKAHSLEISVARRYSNGLSASLAFSANKVTENRVVEAFDREPTAWEPGLTSRPYRISGGAVYELPFGANKPFLKDGFVSKLVGGWQLGGTFEHQPGALIEFTNNVFFNGDINSIAKDNPEIALQSDGTIDATKYWFNTEGFERNAANRPADYQKRAFPFRVDNLRGPGYFLVNANVGRTFGIGGRRSVQFRLDVQNLFDEALYENPNVDPTSTNFGQVRTSTNSIMRFFTFVWKVNF
ncbi:MAG TPA: hypothetical protein VJM31_03915, partial [Vicinamibacterales bacterium]|nr:hypothetical protein [Vicinamibacterales bacterium]